MDNRRILKKAISGDKDAFMELLMENYNHLYRIAYYYLGGEQEAMDAMQETAYRAFKYRKKLKKDSTNIKGWFTRILVNYCRDTLKKESKVIPFEDIYRAQDEKEQQESFEEEFVRESEIYKVVESLRPIYKEVIILRYFQDMKISDIAHVLQRPVNTVKSQLKRGERMCRELLEEGDIYVEGL